MMNFILDLIGFIFLPTGLTLTLNTKKIDKNIALLNEHAWFVALYENVKYRRLFFANRHVRAYLQSTIRVKNMIRNEKARQRFVLFLEKHIKTH